MLIVWEGPGARMSKKARNFLVPPWALSQDAIRKRYKHPSAHDKVCNSKFISFS